MGFEIEFLPVGEASKAGDAIAIRYGSPGNYRIIIVDGGTDAAGELLVAHVTEVYGATVVNDVICTHPDADHSSGLRTVLKELAVERLWLHGLWHRAPNMLHFFNGAWTQQGLEAAIKKEYPIIDELISLAEDRNVPVHEPFAGTTIGPLTVLSPTAKAYEHLVPQFRRTPEANVELLKSKGIWLEAQKNLLARIAEKATAKIANWIPERWDIELLREGAVTAAENESSVVLYGEFDGSGVLLTADAGVIALNWACNNADSFNINLLSAMLVQVPHHGSRSNVSPSVLDRMIGPKLPKGSPEVRKAIVSAPKDDASHPRKMVLNAFLRRGAGVRSTQGAQYRYYSDMPARSANRAEPFGFFDQVEAYD